MLSLERRAARIRGLVLALLAGFLLSSCSVNVKKEANGQDKQVDINTPVGGIHVSKQADASDVGVAVYPNARPKTETCSVLECRTSKHLDLDMRVPKAGREPHELTCDSTSGNNIELKVGTKENQHIVAVEPEGKGSSFSLVYVRTHGKDADI